MYIYFCPLFIHFKKEVLCHFSKICVEPGNLKTGQNIFYGNRIIDWWWSGTPIFSWNLTIPMWENKKIYLSINKMTTRNYDWPKKHGRFLKRLSLSKGQNISISRKLTRPKINRPKRPYSWIGAKRPNGVCSFRSTSAFWSFFAFRVLQGQNSNGRKLKWSIWSLFSKNKFQYSV
jgi:hypothetical protein